jgi:hypothetical protein
MHYQAGTERTTRDIRQSVAFGVNIFEVFKEFLYLRSHLIPNNDVSLEIQRGNQTINFYYNYKYMLLWTTQTNAVRSSFPLKKNHHRVCKYTFELERCHSTLLVA